MLVVPVQPQFEGVLDARCAGPIANRQSVARPLAAGLLYYATDERVMYVYTGSEWRQLNEAIVSLQTLEATVAAIEARLSALEEAAHLHNIHPFQEP